jgi:DNA-binding transcriptional LysR family regulator
MTSNSVAAVRVAVQSGLGVSILPAGAVNQHLRILGEEDGFPDIPPTDLAIYLGENTESDASGAVEVLRQFLSDHVAQRLMMLQRKTAI